MLFSLLLDTAPAQANPIALFAPYVLIAAVFYFLLFMPMQKQKKRLAELVKNLKSGDVVTTNAGIVGTVVSTDDDTVVLRVKPDNVKLQFARSAISALVNPDQPK